MSFQCGKSLRGLRIGMKTWNPGRPLPPLRCALTPPAHARWSPPGWAAPLAGTGSVSSLRPQRWAVAGAQQTGTGWAEEAGKEGTMSEGRKRPEYKERSRGSRRLGFWNFKCLNVSVLQNQSRTSRDESLNPIGLFMEVDDRARLEDNPTRAKTVAHINCKDKDPPFQP